MMRFLLDTNILIPLEDSQHPLEDSLANFIRLASANGHELLYHPASEEDIQQDTNTGRRAQTLQRLRQYTRLDARPTCPWNTSATSRNDAADNEILYAISLNAAHALVTEDRGIHAKAKERGLVQRVYTIQTAEDQLRRLHDQIPVQLPNIEDVPLYSLTPILKSAFFDSLRDDYPNFDSWFEQKAQAGRRAWVSWEQQNSVLLGPKVFTRDAGLVSWEQQNSVLLGGICIYAQQDNERLTDEVTLPGPALKIATFKVGEASRGRKIGELFLKAAFRYATKNHLENIFIHGNRGRQSFLFEMLEDFGFSSVGYHIGCNAQEIVYLKQHPATAPQDSIPPFEYSRKYFPHFRHDAVVSKFIIPIKPEYHRVLFPDYDSPADRQMTLFRPSNTAGNAIKLAYLCHAQTKTINPGDITLFYRSGDERAITSIGVVESYKTLNNAAEIATHVKRRTVYDMEEINLMSHKPTRVMLFRLIRHLITPLSQTWLEQQEILRGPPQSITKMSNENFEKVLSNGK